jgi:hypothetical protein
MNVELIDDYVGHDGQSYFCRGCGRAGFKSVASVRGHLAHCDGRGQLIAAQAPPPPLAHQATSDVALSSFSARVGAKVGTNVGTGTGELNSGDNMTRMWGVMRKIDERLDGIERTLYNELPHQFASAQVQRQDGIGKVHKWLLVALIGLVVLKYLGGDTTKMGSKIGDKVLSKAVDGLLSL